MGAKIKPLHMYGVNNTTEDVISGNLIASFSRAYTPLAYSEKCIGPASIVGAGPSLAWTYKDIVGDVIACNSAHDFLIGRGVIPKYAMVWDAHPVMKGILTPHKDVTYLIASRCHPSVFDLLKDCNVVTWHALGGGPLTEELLVKSNRVEPMIPGGSSSAMRALYLAGAMGYSKELHLFGVDSCYSDDKTASHVNGSIVDQNKMRLRVCGKWFTVASWMAMQAGDAKTIFPDLQKLGVRLIVHGTGLIPYCATFMDGIETPDITIGRYEKVRRKVHGVLAVFDALRTSPNYLEALNAR